MLSALKRKNIESFFVDILIIIGSFFFSKIEVSSEVFLILVLITSVILIISKRPPKNHFLIILYVLSIFFIFFGLIFIVENLFFDIRHNFLVTKFSIVSLLILIFSIAVFFMFIITYSKQNKTYDFLLTYLIPVLLTVLVFTVTYITDKYSAGAGIVIIIYLPLRFLMAYKEPAKWYQFIVLLVALGFTLNSYISAEHNNSAAAVKEELSGIYAKYSVTEFKDYKEDKIVKVVLRKRSYQTPFDEGEYYFITEKLNENWNINYEKTIEYYKKKNMYFSDSSKIHFLIFHIKGSKSDL